MNVRRGKIYWHKKIAKQFSVSAKSFDFVGNKNFAEHKYIVAKQWIEKSIKKTIKTKCCERSERIENFKNITKIKMNPALFNQIKAEYDNFYKNLLRNGKLPMWSTAKGFWNAAIADEVYQAFKSIKLNQFRNFLDIGSGDGKVVLIASLFCKNAEGVEIDNFLHNKAVEFKSKFRINNAVFHNKDFFEHYFSKYDIIFTSPDAPFERGLENKLLKELNGKLIHYGHHFHPGFLKKEDSFLVNGNLVSVYSR